MLWGSGPGALHPISVAPVLLRGIAICWLVLATVTKINSRGLLDHSLLPFGDGPEGDVSGPPPDGLMGVGGGRKTTEDSGDCCTPRR